MHTLVLNIILSAAKLLAGIFARSTALQSDAVHSMSDVVSTLIVIIGVKCAAKKPDRRHPYGHERLECVSALILSVILFITGIGMGYGAGSSLAGEADASAVQGSAGKYAVIAAISSIVIKELMYWYTRGAAKKIGSGALMADAIHHRSDAFSSVGSLLGIMGARYGLALLDPLAGIFICIFVIKAAIDIFADSIKKMLDTACDDQTDDILRHFILGQSEVVAIDNMKTRLFGQRIYVDLEILVDNRLSFEAAHAAAHKVHDAVEREYPEIKHCMVHVSPCSERVI